MWEKYDRQIDDLGCLRFFIWSLYEQKLDLSLVLDTSFWIGYTGEFCVRVCWFSVFVFISIGTRNCEIYSFYLWGVVEAITLLIITKTFETNLIADS